MEFKELWDKGDKKFEYRHDFAIEYELAGQKFVDDALTNLLSIKGQDLSGWSREKLECLHIDLSYYRLALLFAKKELFKKLNVKQSEFALWLAPIRSKLLRDLYDDRIASKVATGVKKQDVTAREIDDELLSMYGKTYFEYDNAIKDIEGDMKFFSDIIDEINSRRIQLQGIVKYMQPDSR